MFIELYRQNERKPTIVNVSHIVFVEEVVFDDAPACRVQLVGDEVLFVTETPDQIRTLLFKAIQKVVFRLDS